MGRTTEPAPDAALFAHAAARLASRAVLLAQRLDEDTPPSRRASRALEDASAAAEELERLAREGADLHVAYRAAARALDAASVALESLDAKARPWLHVVRRAPAPTPAQDEAEA